MSYFEWIALCLTIPAARLVWAIGSYFHEQADLTALHYDALAEELRGKDDDEDDE